MKYDLRARVPQCDAADGGGRRRGAGARVIPWVGACDAPLYGTAREGTHSIHGGVKTSKIQL